MKVLALKLVIAALLLVSVHSSETVRRVDPCPAADNSMILILSGTPAASRMPGTAPVTSPPEKLQVAFSRPVGEFPEAETPGETNFSPAAGPALPQAPQLNAERVDRMWTDARDNAPVLFTQLSTQPIGSEGESPSNPDSGESDGEHVLGPEIPFDLLASMVTDDPWQDTLSDSEDNPFSHVIYEMTAPRGGNGGSSSSDTSNSGGGSSTDGQGNDDSGQDQNRGNDTSDNGGQLPTGGDDADQGDVDGVFPEVMVFWAESGNNRYACTSQLGQNRFRFGPGDIRRIEFFWLPYSRVLDEHYLLDDFNHDGLTDVLITLRSKLSCQLHLNAGNGWTDMPAMSLPYQPTSACRISLPNPSVRNLAYYSNTLQVMDILEPKGNGTFSSLLRFSVPADFDSLSSTDFNRDGLDDLVLVNFEQNRVFYLLNINNRAFRPLSGNLASFTRSEIIRFVPRPSGQEARSWWCTFGTQNLIYLANYRGRPVSVATLNLLDAGSCLLLGDFNQDGIPDIGIGRLVN